MIEKTFRYIVQLSNVSPWFYFCAIVMGLIVGLVMKKIRLGVLVGYMVMVFCIAVLSRKSKDHINNFVLFISFQRGAPEQIFANILFFIPIGSLLASISYKILWIGPSFSLFIELFQLVFHKGTFDVDDLLNNSIGIVIGTLLVIIIGLASTKNRNHLK